MSESVARAADPPRQPFNFWTAPLVERTRLTASCFRGRADSSCRRHKSAVVSAGPIQSRLALSLTMVRSA